MILGTGAIAPEFDLSDQFGAPQRLGARRGIRGVVLVFVPFAFSRTCTGELHDLDAHADLFAASGADLLVASVDAKYALRAWAESEGVGLTLVSDFWPHGAVARAYGAFDERAGHARRATFAIGADGVIRSSFMTGPGEPRPMGAYREALSAL
ncbi:peroxiredoxin [Agromyces flavus]|uniref:Peroxiredoxin n=1 Tax=Agromyces flavus TaxID=589382 RepID=A0A1H1RT95_9MICO|nr:redoxin domain-containing protein [Agromyces flavus]MCP2368882.1 peroxiredoxin [Agromyces flavus]GGI48339.1 peroxiredoxin [Agromyces flavus]SDS38951.1 Peroxiredoxin [Agromyces flavus]